MNKGKIGIQFSTMKRAVKELGLYETLKKSAELGYHCIEISQTPMTRENIEIFKRARDEFGMEVAALTAKVEGGMAGQDCLVNDYDKVVSDCHELGAHLLRIGMGPIYTMNTMEDALAYCDSVRPYVERLKADGIDYYYHNHSLEFRKFDGKYLLDIIREKSGLGFEIDIHWVQVGGRDPVQLLKEYAGSIKLVHLKDYRIVPCKKDMRELFSAGVNPQSAAVQFAEIGEGNLDIKGCIEAGLAGGAEYFLIEMDTTYDLTPFESLKISRDNLCRMGYEDWF